ncbi:RNA polymerase sigma factor [Agrobacterium sp. ES01]|uniref:RNA polymerase sigma factor n=1 Tax=Agrobacterium sp. ES01 TaxID=3420714 RepID=UPI003D116865
MTWDIQDLFRKHARGIARSLRRRGVNEDTAADLTQDTFVRVIASPPANGSLRHNPEGYLYVVSRNLGINHLKRERLVPLVALDHDIAETIADPSPSAERVAYARQCLVMTHTALAELPERTRLAFEMHRLGERTIAEVADELGISTTRAWSLIREAYRHLITRVDPL